MLRAGDVVERGEFEAAVAEMRAGRVFDFQTEEAFLDGVRTLLADDPEGVERIEQALAAEKEAAEAAGPGNKPQLAAEDRALLEQSRAAVLEHWPPYSTLVGRMARRNELLPTLAFQWFCTGWSGKDLPEFKKGIDGRVTIAALSKIPALTLRVAGMQAYQMQYATGFEKNSAPPLPSDKSLRPSTSDAPREGGTSAARSGRKTRSSRSRGGRSTS
jgi:hypothetical protein